MHLNNIQNKRADYDYFVVQRKIVNIVIVIISTMMDEHMLLLSLRTDTYNILIENSYEISIS